MHAKMSNKRNAKNHFGKRRSQIETKEEEKINISKKNNKMKNDNDSNISEHQMIKWMLRTKPSDNDQIIRIIRRSTLSNQEDEHWWYDNWFTDEFSEESSELSREPEESIRNLISFTEIIQSFLVKWTEIDFLHVQLFGIWRTKYSRRD